jgi:hypothetical protein
MRTSLDNWINITLYEFQDNIKDRDKKLPNATYGELYWDLILLEGNSS